jgi:riboflavin biosynthesis pyrimidine reductase
VRLTWYTAMSMDGRIATADQRLDFLGTIGAGAERDFAAFLAGIDAVLIGATTFRWLLDGGHGWPHDDLPTWLVSHDETLVERVGRTRAPVVRRAGDLGGVLDEIERAGHEHVWLSGGGDVAGQALADGRLDDVVVTIAPTVVGSGPPLFGVSAAPANRFALVEARGIGGDAVRVHWRRVTTP